MTTTNFKKLYKEIPMNTSFLHHVTEYVFTYFSWGYLYFSAGYFGYDKFHKDDVSMRRLPPFLKTAAAAQGRRAEKAITENLRSRLMWACFFYY